MVFLLTGMQQTSSFNNSGRYSLAWCLLAAFLLHIAAYLIWGLYYNEYTDKFFTAYVDGSFDNGITKPIFYNYGFFTAISQVMAWGYCILPQFNWYGIIGQVFLIFTTGGFLFLLRSLFQSFSAQRRLIALATVALVLFWFYHIVLYRTTELSFLACGISTFALVLSFAPPVSENMGSLTIARAYFLVLILLSALIRVEPVLMCSVMLAPYALLVVGDRRNWPGMVKVALVVLVGFGGAYGLYMSALGPGAAKFKEIRVYTHTIWDFGQDNSDLTLHSAADSVKLEAAQQFFISDETGMDGAFYQSIGILPLEKSLSSLPGYLPDLKMRMQRAVGIWLELMKSQWVLFGAFVFAMVGAMAVLLYNSRWLEWMYLMLLQMWFWLILFGITVFMKMELRVFCPLLTLNLLALLWLPCYWLFGKGSSKRFSGLIVMSTWSLVLMMGLFRFQDMRVVTADYKQAAQNIRAFKTELLNTHADKTIFFNSISWQLLYADLFDTNELQQKVKLLALDNGELFMYPSHQQTMQQWCGSAGLGDIGNCILDRKDEVLFVSSTDRMQLIERYMQTVYGLNFHVSPVFPNAKLSVPVGGGKMLPTYMEQHNFSYFVLQ